MGVNSLISAFKSQRVQLVAALLICLCAILFLAAFVTGRPEGELFSRRVNIAVRAIGHDLLLRAGDSTSVVRPVTEKSPGVFLLEFENEFKFQPDTLAAVVQRFLAKTDLSHYTVTVQQCDRPDIVYGFEINPPDNSIQPCQGRSQPKACYNIEIAFAGFPKQSVINPETVMMISGLLSVLAVVLIFRNVKMKAPIPVDDLGARLRIEGSQVLPVGKFLFEKAHQRLRIGEESIPLTDKECTILALLQKHIGQLTLRDELIQEVWTDEGVITGRSLDMFISRLRKKLSADSALRITNVHGKGYKLEIL